MRKETPSKHVNPLVAHWRFRTRKMCPWQKEDIQTRAGFLFSRHFPTPTQQSREEENEVGGMWVCVSVCVTFFTIIKNQQEWQRRNGSHSRDMRELQVYRFQSPTKPGLGSYPRTVFQQWAPSYLCSLVCEPLHVKDRGSSFGKQEH